MSLDFKPYHNMPNNSPLLDTLLQILEDMQAKDITVIDVHDQTPITDYMVIATGRASRHVKAIAEELIFKMKENHQPALHHSGIDFGEWALIDFGDVIIHVMQSESRIFYNLEELWQK